MQRVRKDSVMVLVEALRRQMLDIVARVVLIQHWIESVRVRTRTRISAAWGQCAIDSCRFFEKEVAWG